MTSGSKVIAVCDKRDTKR